MLDLITIFSAAGLQQARPILELMVSFQHPAETTDLAWIWANFHLELEEKKVPGSSIEYTWLEWHVKRPCVFNAALTSGDESSKWRQKPDDPWGIRSWEMLRDPKFVPYELLGRYGWRSPWMLNRLAWFLMSQAKFQSSAWHTNTHLTSSVHIPITSCF